VNKKKKKKERVLMLHHPGRSKRKKKRKRGKSLAMATDELISLALDDPYNPTIHREFANTVTERCSMGPRLPNQN